MAPPPITLDDGQSQDSQMVVVNPAGAALGQAFLYLRRDHLLSASVVRKIVQKEISLYRFAEQPCVAPWPLYPVVDIIHPKINGSSMPLVPYNGVLLESETSYGSNAPIDIAPISYITPEGYRSLVIANPHDQIAMTSDDKRVPDAIALQLSYVERKENWYIRLLPRTNGTRRDPYYVHIKTDKQVRSLKQVYDFVVHALVPDRNKSGKKASKTKKQASDGEPSAKGNAKVPGAAKGDKQTKIRADKAASDHPPRKGKGKGKVPAAKEDKQRKIRGDTIDKAASAKGKGKIRGDTLIERVKVGYYNLTRDKVVRNKPAAAPTSETDVPNGSKKRKRPVKEETTFERMCSEISWQIEESEMSDIWYVLYDMEPKQPHHRPPPRSSFSPYNMQPAV